MQIEKGIDKIVKTFRLPILDRPGTLGRVATAMGNTGGNIADLHLVSYGLEYNTRDLTIFLGDEAQRAGVFDAKPGHAQSRSPGGRARRVRVRYGLGLQPGFDRRLKT